VFPTFYSFPCLDFMKFLVFHGAKSFWLLPKGVPMRILLAVLWIRTGSGVGMRQGLRVAFFCLAVTVGGGMAGFGQDFSMLSEAERKQVNGWMAERAAILADAHKIEIELDQAWGNPQFTSPEVEAQRERYRQLQHELMMTQLTLRRLVEKLPAAQSRQSDLDALRNRAEALSRQIEAKGGVKR